MYVTHLREGNQPPSQILRLRAIMNGATSELLGRPITVSLRHLAESVKESTVIAVNQRANMSENDSIAWYSIIYFNSQIAI